MQRCSRWSRRIGGAPSALRLNTLLYIRLSKRSLYTEQSGTTKNATGHLHRQYGPGYVPKSILPPPSQRSDPNAWLSILERVIPQRLSTKDTPSVEAGDAVKKDELSPDLIANVIALVRRAHRIDLLLYLFEHGRSKVVVWLVTHLVDSLWTSNPLERRKPIDGPWSKHVNLESTTNKPIRLEEIGPAALLERAANGISLEEAVETNHPLAKQARAKDGHAILGQIWQSLGNMILADAKKNAAIAPEILEIVALLHHRSIMPESIYSYAPYKDNTALRQPPTLHLLSSHILTSLSDAVWRAHETSVVEEAKAKGGFYNSLRPEIPGSMYRVRVGGLRHEVWLELVLWSCLQGGWISYGAAILDVMSMQKRPNMWSALSWREIASPMVRPGDEQVIDWNEVRYLFNTGTYGDPEATAAQRSKISNTVSSEVVTAYVDALVNMVRVGVGERGIAPGAVLNQINVLKAFLERNNLGLESTSWDAVVLRMFESQGINIESEPSLAEGILQLSPPYGRELATSNAPSRDEQWQPLSPYLIDGTAATLGVAHRVLLAHMQAGNIAGALRSFDALQKRTDRNKIRSIEEFFKLVKKSPIPHDDSGLDFAGRYARIDYPGFHPQIPITVLAPFLNLITDAKAFAFGSWLLESQDPDGPTITKAMYSQPVMIPSLIRFASASRNKELLAKVLEGYRSSKEYRAGELSSSLQLALLETRIQFNDWPAASTTLQELTRASTLEKSTFALAIAMVVRAILRLTAEVDRQEPEEVRSNLKQAVELYARTMQIRTISSRQGAMIVISVAMASVNDEWARLSLMVKQLPSLVVFDMEKEAFNIILEGVVDAYGGETGRRLLASFWQPARDESNDEQAASANERDEDQGGVPRMPFDRPGAFAEASPNRVSMNLVVPNSSEGATEDSTVKVRGKFRPNISTIRIILRSLLPDNDAAQAQKTRDWAFRVLRQLNVRDQDIKEELEGKYTIQDASQK